MDFVGHSNGTYLLGSALQRYRSSTFGRVVCAGSVLPRDFEWDEMVPKPGVEGRIKAIRSYVASRDWVVGIFPNLFDGWTDIGGGGFLGFLREPAVSSQYLCVSGSHGGAIVADNFDSIIAFVLDGRLVPPPERLRAAERSKWVELFSKLDWAIWGLLVAAVVAIGWSLVWAAPLLGVAWWLPVGIYVLLLLLVLNTL
jgi:hypothetical protein